MRLPVRIPTLALSLGAATLLARVWSVEEFHSFPSCWMCETLILILPVALHDETLKMAKANNSSSNILVIGDGEADHPVQNALYITTVNASHRYYQRRYSQNPNEPHQSEHCGTSSTGLHREGSRTLAGIGYHCRSPVRNASCRSR